MCLDLAISFIFLAGHNDSVSCTGFSSDAVYVATGDMAGLVQVWAVADRKKVWSFETGDLEVQFCV